MSVFMDVYRYAQGLADQTGWNDQSIARLLGAFIDENGDDLQEKAGAFLDAVAQEEIDATCDGEPEEEEDA